MKISEKTRRLIHESLREDIGREDITTRLLVPKELKGEAMIDAKANGILCGGLVVKEVFRFIDSKLNLQQEVSEGSSFSKGKKIIRISGKISSILKGERTALNFLSHLSGIATITNQYVQKIKGTRARIYDTRKTTPLWRELEKYAVITGGGKNHRFGLWDEVLVKDNHWVAIQKAWQKNPFLLKEKLGKRKVPIQIEVGNLKELSCLLNGNFMPDRILLDNFSMRNLKEAVKMTRKRKHGILLEASGGITLRNVAAVAKTGVDRISIGALTHSAPAIDFSLTVLNVNS